MTIEKLKKLDYEPKSRNKIIVDVLMRKRLMDKRGTGILRMKEGMEKWGLPQPTFKENTGYFVIEFVGPYQGTVIQIREKLNSRQRKAIEYLSKYGKITNREYRKLNKIVKDTARRDLNDLLYKKIISRRGHGAHVYYVLKSVGKSVGKSVDKEKAELGAK